MRSAYFGGSRGLVQWGRNLLLEALRRWDRATARRVTHFIANSRVVQQRIRDCYGRDSTVIYPPVDTQFYTPACAGSAPLARDDYYLVVSAFAPYKRVDLAIRACQRLGRRLVIVGTGQDERRLRALAGPATPGASVHFTGWLPDAAIRDHFRCCRALLFPGEEDFGIVPVEAQACGAPVIAFGQGGATETVLPAGSSPEPTGLWFQEQTEECLVETLTRFESCREALNPAAARKQALKFNARRFAVELFDFLANVVESGRAPLRRAA
jgi:glycosyltransferase involved in cell wall biosynthesis